MQGRGLGFWLGLTSFAAATPALAQLGEDRLYRSAYFLGRGDAGLAIADDEEAIFYNPAGVAQGKGIYKKTVLASPQVEVSESTRDLGKRIMLQDDDAVDAVLDQVGRPNHFGVTNFTGVILRRAALGVVASGQVDLLASKSASQGGLETVQASAAQNVAATFTLAEAFLKDTLLIGTTVKYLYRGRGHIEASAAESERVQEEMSDQSRFLGIGSGTGADLGLMYKMGGGRSSSAVGLTVTDVGTTSVKPHEDTELDLDVKQTVNVGFALEPGTQFSKLRLLFDYRDILSAKQKNPRLKTHLGAELTVADRVGFSGGLNQGYPTFGLYGDVYILRVDLGFYTEELSEHAGRRADTRYFLRIKTGF